jgi:hypothetical protein
MFTNDYHNRLITAIVIVQAVTSLSVEPLLNSYAGLNGTFQDIIKIFGPMEQEMENLNLIGKKLLFDNVRGDLSATQIAASYGVSFSNANPNKQVYAISLPNAKSAPNVVSTLDTGMGANSLTITFANPAEAVAMAVVGSTDVLACFGGLSCGLH